MSDDDFDLPMHPVAALFPRMNEDEFKQLTDSVVAHGLIHSVVVHEGKIVDGGNRVKACKAAGVPVRTVEWREVYTGDQSVEEWIWVTNANRRSLTEDQKVAIRIQVSAYLEREAAKRRQMEAGNHGSKGGRGHKKTLEPISAQGFRKSKRAPQVRTRIMQALNAAGVKVSRGKVQRALNVEKANPALLKEVEKGTMTLKEAAKAAKESGALRSRAGAWEGKKRKVDDGPTLTCEAVVRLARMGRRLSNEEVASIAGFAVFRTDHPFWVRAEMLPWLRIEHSHDSQGQPLHEFFVDEELRAICSGASRDARRGGVTILESASSVLHELRQLLLEIERRRSEYDLRIHTRNWNPDGVNKKHLIELLDWAEEQIRLLVSSTLLADDLGSASSTQLPN